MLNVQLFVDPLLTWYQPLGVAWTYLTMLLGWDGKSGNPWTGSDIASRGQESNFGSQITTLPTVLLLERG